MPGWNVVRSFGQIVPVPGHAARLGLLSDVDDGGQVWDWQRKVLVVDLPHWTGQCVTGQCVTVDWSVCHWSV